MCFYFLSVFSDKVWFSMFFCVNRAVLACCATTMFFLALAANRLMLAQRLVDGLFPTGDGYAARLTLGRRAQLGDEMVYRSTVGRSPVGPHG